MLVRSDGTSTAFVQVDQCGVLCSSRPVYEKGDGGMLVVYNSLVSKGGGKFACLR